MDESFDRIDTIFAKNDKFSYTASIDTITSAFLLIRNQTEYPIFLDKENQIKIKGDINHPEYLDINGNIYNEEFTTFQKELTSLPTPSEKDLEQKAVLKGKDLAESFAQWFDELYLGKYDVIPYFKIEKVEDELFRLKVYIKDRKMMKVF